MGKYDASNQEPFIPTRKFKRVSSTESLSTFYELQKTTIPRIIPAQVKASFIELITKKNFSMKEAAKFVEMSYSTAKKIYGKFRRQNIQKQTSKVEQMSYRSGYAQIPQNKINKIEIFCLIAGNEQK